MEWSPQQADALKKIKRWAKDRSGQQVFRLFGFAGTGKTTLAREIANAVGGNVLYMAPTGKASLVLRKKGCAGASTIHSAIYKPVQDETTGEVTFTLNPDSGVAHAALVVLDEASMADEFVGTDLLSYGTKVLVLGDPAQLPPVKGEGFFTNAEPDILLTEIHRQASESPIIRMSMDVREGRGLVVGSYGNSSVVARHGLDKDAMREAVMKTDQLLAGMNRTRRTFNARIRQIKRDVPMGQWQPIVGDRLVCLKNNRMKGLLNGGLWEAMAVQVQSKKVLMKVSSIDDPDVLTPIEVEVAVDFFKGTEKDMQWYERKKSDEFDFGDCLTVHKSQGSAWDDVLVYDESSVFRENSARHLYTAITRAAERVTVITG